jgi:hypothetical protein
MLLISLHSILITFIITFIHTIPYHSIPFLSIPHTILLIQTYHILHYFIPFHSYLPLTSTHTLFHSIRRFILLYTFPHSYHSITFLLTVFTITISTIVHGLHHLLLPKYSILPVRVVPYSITCFFIPFIPFFTYCFYLNYFHYSPWSSPFTTAETYHFIFSV